MVSVLFSILLLSVVSQGMFKHVLKIWRLPVSVELEDRLNHCKQVQKDSSKKAEELEKKLKNAKSIQEQALKNAENEMQMQKRKSEESRAQWKQREQVI
jgi:TolA-binding protein